MTNLIVVDGEIGNVDPLMGLGVSLSQITSQFDAAASDIEVHINSVGGDVGEGFAIYDFLKSTGKPVTTVVTGKCYSIATIIFLAGDKRLMQPNAEIMIHNPWGKIEGTADQIQQYADWIAASEEKILNFYVKQTGGSKPVIRQMMDDQTFMNYEEAKKNGFATGQVKELKAVAIYNPNNSKMNELTPEAKKELADQLEKSESRLTTFIKSFFKSHIKNMVLETTDSKIIVESEDENIIGKNIFTANEKGEQADPVADGLVTLNDGRKLTIKDGKVESIEDKNVDEELKALKAENEELKKQIETDAEKLKKSEEEILVAQNSLKEIRTTLLGEPPPATPPKARKQEEPEDGFSQFAQWGEKTLSNN